MDYHFETIDNVMKVSLDGRLVAACSEEFKNTMLNRLKDQKAIDKYGEEAKNGVILITTKKQ